jgi:hypothetical protein
MLCPHHFAARTEASLPADLLEGPDPEKARPHQVVKKRSVLYEIEKGNPQKSIYEAFKYAPLEDIDKHLGPPLAKEEIDLSYSDEPREGGGIVIRGRLKHRPLERFPGGRGRVPGPIGRTLWNEQMPGQRREGGEDDNDAAAHQEPSGKDAHVVTSPLYYCSKKAPTYDDVKQASGRRQA